MRRIAVFACISAAALLSFGCADDGAPILGVDNPATDLELARPAHAGLKPGGYYSFDWSYETGAYSELLQIKTANGVGTFIWRLNLQPDPNPEVFGPMPTGLTFDVDGTMYTILNILAFDPSLVQSQLARVDSQTGDLTTIGFPVPFNTSGPEIDACGNMYVCGFQVDALGYVWGNSNLWRVDKATGQFNLVGDTGHTNWMDLAFDSGGTLWATKENELWTIDPGTGASTFVTEIFGVPDAGAPRFMEVMSIAFDKHDVLYGTAMTVYYEDPKGSPVMSIDVNSGVCTLKGYTLGLSNHGGDTMPMQVRVAHLGEGGVYTCETISLDALPAHLAHGDYVPGTAGHPCDCP